MEATMTTAHVARPSLAERRAEGNGARSVTPPDRHAGWAPASDRADPVALLEEQNRSRDADLVPVRHARMLVSPFTFYRGAARIMAEDLRRTPRAGLTVQLCGDAHLSNFGVFASPERSLVFDINDFDETLPGPFEYDVKRLATSFTIAARNNGFAKADVRAVTRESVRSYRNAMAAFAEMNTLDVWYAHLSEAELLKLMQAAITELSASGGNMKQLKKLGKRAKVAARKAHGRDSRQALAKLGELVDGRYRIVSQPPYIVPLRDWDQIYPSFPENPAELIEAQFKDFGRTLRPDLQRLLERFELVDVARKVVGVGSVGTRAFVGLLQGRDENDPLFLQLKEATRSVLESHLPKSRYRQHGQRVVQGQRLMQATSDIFLGWSTGADTARHYYWRQLRDMKGSVVVEEMIPEGMTFYAATCGWTLARAHARSGDPVAIAEYLGTDDAFDAAITDFGKRYAEQNEQDFEAFDAAVRTGRIAAVQEA
jgi:uncharacterized protein (DUF2252 family)